MALPTKLLVKKQKLEEKVRLCGLGIPNVEIWK